VAGDAEALGASMMARAALGWGGMGLDTSNFSSATPDDDDEEA